MNEKPNDGASLTRVGATINARLGQLFQFCRERPCLSEEEVWDHYRNNPQALATVRAPIFEEKVVDFLVELAKVTEKAVSQGGRRGSSRRRTGLRVGASCSSGESEYMHSPILR